MSVQRVYVGEPGENPDVGRENTNKETSGKIRFDTGDVVTIPSKLADRLGPQWVTESQAKNQEAEADEEGADASSDQGGDSQ